MPRHPSSHICIYWNKRRENPMSWPNRKEFFQVHIPGRPWCYWFSGNNRQMHVAPSHHLRAACDHLWLQKRAVRQEAFWGCNVWPCPSGCISSSFWYLDLFRIPVKQAHHYARQHHRGNRSPFSYQAPTGSLMIVNNGIPRWIFSKRLLVIEAE